MSSLLTLLASLLALWLLLEIGLRLYLELPLDAGYYSSIPPQGIAAQRAQTGLKVAAGSGWIHLGWIADPRKETYRVEKWDQDHWMSLGQTQFGSYLHETSLTGKFRVVVLPKDGSQPKVLGEATAAPHSGPSPCYLPTISGPWQVIFKPQQNGSYINDHTLYQDQQGDWRVLGITDKSEGDFNHEVYFAAGVSPDFPPSQPMAETDPVADFGSLAWAPHVIQSGGKFHLFWSPHQLHQMESEDGIHWNRHRVTLSAPYHKFFRDPMVLQVAEDQWLLYTTARGAYFSQIDIYQSFDLETWQYIRTALHSTWGSERNAPFASMESPFVTCHQNHYYLSLTYNNDSFFWPGILLLFHIWLQPKTYNETLVFHAANPYNFGTYRGRNRSPTLLTQLEAHAPEIIFQPDTGQWYITTAGWPWAASLTNGEVACAHLTWHPIPNHQSEDSILKSSN